MEEKKVIKTHMPWPSRLANWSWQSGKWGSISLGVGILSYSISIIDIIPLPVGIYIIIGHCILFFISLCVFLFVAGVTGALALSLIALVGMSFYRFKVPRLGRAVGVFMSAFIVFVGVCVFSYWATLEARKINCAENLRELSLDLNTYKQDNGSWPDKEHWNDLISPYLSEECRIQCPADKIGPCSYAMNENIPADANYLPTDLVVLFESKPGWNNVGGMEDVVADRHKGCWISFADGSRKFVMPEEIPDLRWTVEKNTEQQ